MGYFVLLQAILTLFGLFLFIYTSLDLFLTIGLLIGVCMSIMTISCKNAKKSIKQISLTNSIAFGIIYQIILIIGCYSKYNLKFGLFHKQKLIYEIFMKHTSSIYILALFIINAILIAINIKAYSAEEDNNDKN